MQLFILLISLSLSLASISINRILDNIGYDDSECIHIIHYIRQRGDIYCIFNKNRPRLLQEIYHNSLFDYIDFIDKSFRPFAAILIPYPRDYSYYIDEESEFHEINTKIEYYNYDHHESCTVYMERFRDHICFYTH